MRIGAASIYVNACKRERTSMDMYGDEHTIYVCMYI